jgi:NADH-quinone oxidoreductase subunit L
LIVLAILAAIGGLISFPTNSWLSGYLAPLFKYATEEHHFGHKNTFLWQFCCRWISRNRIAFSKYIKQNQVPAADADQRFCKGVYNKYYVDEAYDTIFVKTTNGSNFL